MLIYLRGSDASHPDLRTLPNPNTAGDFAPTDSIAQRFHKYHTGL
jgi:hypothetical protein